MGVARVAVEETELAGCPIHKGDQVMIMIGSANTDEAEFPDADVVRFDREVNRHIAFGGGIHRCLGSNLARLELPRRATGMAQADTRLRHRARPHARLHLRHPLHRGVPAALHGAGIAVSALRRPPLATCVVHWPSCQ